jgi:protein-S-isoprenylcysteine O-methyltransferase Ste14
LAGAGSRAAGLGLWQQMPLAIAIEGAVVVAGLALFLRGSGLPRGRPIALAVVALVVLGFTLAGMTIAPAPPSAAAMAGTSLATLLVACALVGWITRAAPGEPPPGKHGP